MYKVDLKYINAMLRGRGVGNKFSLAPALQHNHELGEVLFRVPTMPHACQWKEICAKILDANSHVSNLDEGFDRGRRRLRRRCAREALDRLAFVPWRTLCLPGMV